MLMFAVLATLLPSLTTVWISYIENKRALQAKASSPAGTGGGFADVGGSANPTSILTYSGPVSNDPVAVTFQQHIGSTDPLRTGSYSKTLTFTLSTTNP